ncbi:unnamed protein product, partial [Lepidochelys olivacea]
MALALRLLLLLGAAALPGARSRLHSTRIYNTVVSEPGPGLPWYSAVGYVDDQLFVDYTSEKRRVEPHTEWMARNVDPQHWDEQTWRARRWQAWFNASLNALRELYNHNKENDQGSSGSDLSAKGVKDSSERDFSVAADTAWAELSFCKDNSSCFREQSPVKLQGGSRRDRAQHLGLQEPGSV